jgi:hypothetical protein
MAYLLSCERTHSRYTENVEGVFIEWDKPLNGIVRVFRSAQLQIFRFTLCLPYPQDASRKKLPDDQYHFR